MSSISMSPTLTASISDELAARSEADYVLSPDVLFIPADDGTARLLDLGGEFFSVSDVGAMMLQIVLKRGTDAAVEDVSRRFAADPQQVRDDLVAMLADFEQKGLIRSVHRADAKPRRVRAIIAWCMALPLLIILTAPLSLKRKGFVLLALARLSCALAGWTATIRAWKTRTGTSPADASCDEAAATEVDRAVRAAASQHLFQVACKERALSCWALARAARLNAELVVGITFFPVAGHCWCEVGQLPISDDVRRISDFRPVARWA